jgi:hypothetical protein
MLVQKIMNLNKYKPNKWLTKKLDPICNDQNKLLQSLFDFVCKNKNFKIGSCEKIVKSADNCLIYYSVDRNGKDFIKIALQEQIYKKLLKSPRLAAVYSLIVTKNKLPSQIHNKIAEFLIEKKGISVSGLLRSFRNFKEDHLEFLIKHAFEEIENEGVEIYLYKYMNK